MTNRTDTIPGLEAALGEPERIESVFDLTSARVEQLKRRKSKTLGIVCGRTDCVRNLHCFRPKERARASHPGPCQQCGADLVNWTQVHARNTLNTEDRFELLKKEWVRHFFFHVPITPRVEGYARKYGFHGLVDVARHQLGSGKMLRFIEEGDFNQTKMLDGTIVHWARHAVACCCRRCMAYWHNVPLAAELSMDDINYFGRLVGLYIKHRMPELEDFGVPAHSVAIDYLPPTERSNDANPQRC